MCDGRPTGAYERKNLQYDVYTLDGRLVDSVTGQWLWSQERLQQEIENNNVEFVEQEDGSVRLYKKDYLEDGRLERPISYFDKATTDNSAREINALFCNIEETFFAKPVGLIKHLVNLARTNSSIILDFFAGSGTTAHAVMNLNREDGGDRKYILVEMGDYFDTVLKPRIQKVAFSANWKDGVPQDRDGQSHVFKYQRIESYEDALNNIRVRQPEGAQRRLLYDEFDDYQIHYMLDFETRESATLLTQEAFETPFAYTLKIQRGHASPQDTVVDLVETFHYLIGMHVQRLERHEHQGRPYVVSRGEVRSTRGVEKVVVVWRDTENLDLGQEADWANGEDGLLAEPVDRVYVNGPSHIDQAQPLEITFRERMEGGRRAV